ncbi:LysE family transporter [Photobacterium sp. WH77]|uniref:LysE family transporter n=1 Tax=Photobacterium TaxID=657 RepID=UPI001EDA33A5|nr:MULTISPECIES: LysE family transporter [Photobacterium]MCG2835275.1 LysE family transporter [Photobacterium sp. WH77]MCG2842888.1 LysE family transporter [Photobacterium sp. WH80]MDO6583000.1 LysE family transporter [Photobacterium sp. 2_MG-2023]
MAELFAVALITILAVISPGADFAMVTRNSYLHGRRAGLYAALGIALGVLIHVGYTMLGVGVLIATSPALFTVIKYVGALYLVYIGFCTLRSKTELTLATDNIAVLSGFASFRQGLLTNALNPKTTLFVLSTFTQIVSPDTSLLLQSGYGLFMSLAHWIWFSLVALFFSQQALRHKMLSKQGPINRTIGSILMLLGGSLALSPMAG